MSPASPLEVLGAFGAASAGLFGLLVGSFLNVLVHRLPRDESIVRPGSHCPACGAGIGPFDNIPVLSWILLRARCRACGAPISIRYPLVELANGLFWVAVYWRAPSWGDFASGALLCSSCLALAWIDADFQLLPDAITLPGVAAGLALSFFSFERTPLQAALGAAAGGLGLLLVGLVYRLIKRVEGMGLGDVKMLAMLGAFLGPSGIVLTVLLASLSGSLVGLALIARGRGGLATRLPFGVFLAGGGVATYFFGAFLLGRYRSLWP